MASILRAVSASSSLNANSSSPTNDLGKRLAKWALVIGVPTAVCVAAYLVYRQQQDQAKKSATRRTPLPKPFANITTTISSSQTKVADDTVLSPESQKKVSIQFLNHTLTLILVYYLESVKSCG